MLEVHVDRRIITAAAPRVAAVDPQVLGAFGSFASVTVECPSTRPLPAGNLAFSLGVKSMLRAGVIIVFLTCAIVGCRQYEKWTTDPDGNRVVLHDTNAAIHDIALFGVPSVLLVLGLGAFLHWRRTGYWCLAALTSSALAMVVGVVAGRLGEWRMLGAPVDEIISGSRAPIQWLMSVQQWFVAIGFVLAGVGGVGAIILAVRQNRDSTAFYDPAAVKDGK